MSSPSPPLPSPQCPTILLLPVLSAHADGMSCLLSFSSISFPTAITGLGDDVRYDVIEPVLECCSADTLLRLEQSSPVSPPRFITASPLTLDVVSRTRHLRQVPVQHQIRFISPDSTSSDLWERLCFKSYPLLAEQLTRNADDQPESWRDQYFVCPRPL